MNRNKQTLSKKQLSTFNVKQYLENLEFYQRTWRYVSNFRYYENAGVNILPKAV